MNAPSSTGRGVSLLALVTALTLVVGLALLGQPQTALAAGVPGPPRDVHGLHTDSQGERVTVGWLPPLDDGGTPITTYRVQASKDGIHWTATEESEDELIVAFDYTLDVYSTYVFRAAAANSAGWGEWSAISPPFTVLPGDHPRVEPPRNVVATPVLRGLRIAWVANLAGHDVYLVQWSRNGGPWEGSRWTRGTTMEVTDLARGDYQVRVRTQIDDGVEFSVWVGSETVTVPDRRQRIVDFAGLPDHMVVPGKTVLAPCGLVTNANQRVRVAVRWQVARGDVGPAITVRRRSCGKVIITTTGQPATVKVTLAAPSSGRYAEYFHTRTYRVG